MFIILIKCFCRYNEEITEVLLFERFNKKIFPRVYNVNVTKSGFCFGYVLGFYLVMYYANTWSLKIENKNGYIFVKTYISIHNEYLKMRKAGRHSQKVLVQGRWYFTWSSVFMLTRALPIRKDNYLQIVTSKTWDMGYFENSLFQFHIFLIKRFNFI
jgi:hypothetical protein